MAAYHWQPWDLERLTPIMVTDALEDYKQRPRMF